MAGGPARPGAPAAVPAPPRPRARGWLFPTLSGYQRSSVGPDVVAGITAGAVVIPQAMAYATIANLPVQYGLYTCIVPLVVYAALGGSRAMSVSTTSTIATLTATTFVTAGAVAAAPDEAPAALSTLVLLVGTILLLARLLKLGSLVENISRATIIGIQVGVGATVAVAQLPTLLGVDDNFAGHGFIRSLIAVIEAVPSANLATILLSAGSIAALVLFRRFLPRVPGPLVVVVAGILLATLGGIERAGVELIPTVPQGIPLPSLPSLRSIPALLPGAFAIAIMAFLESSAVARGIREQGAAQIDSNRELFAAGAANFAGAFFHTLPAAGGFSQSAVNQRAGARSQFAGLVTAALAVLVALFLGPVLSLLPQATLAAMVFVAVIGLIDVKSLARLARLNPVEFWIATATAVVGLTAGLLPAVAVGVVVTLILVLRELNRPRVDVVMHRDGSMELRPVVALYTANVLGTTALIERLVHEAGDPPVVVLDLSVIRVTSTTVLDTLADLDRELASGGVELRVKGLAGSPLEMARKTEWWQALEASGRTDAHSHPSTGSGSGSSVS